MFNLMVVGESGVGKTTLLNTLFSTLIMQHSNEDHRWQHQHSRTVRIQVTRIDVEEKGFPARISLIDTPGLGDYTNNTECWLPVMDYINEQYYNYMTRESKTDRGEVDDSRVHCVLYFIPPSGHTLRPLDIELMKRLGARTNLIPVIAKADTLTPSHLKEFKENIRTAMQAHGINVFTVPLSHENDDELDRISKIESAMPFAVIGSEQDVTTSDGRKVRGRQYQWGVAEVENDAHCDFKLLRTLVIRTHMHTLINTTSEIHYENYRSNRLATEGKSDDDPISRARKAFELKIKEDEEILRKRFTEQVRIQEGRFKEWEGRLLTERDRLNKELEAQHQAVKRLAEEIQELQKTEHRK